MNNRKLLAKALSGTKNLRFAEALALAKAFGFRLSRVKGSHHIFVHPQLRELINLQEVGGKAKPYQIRRVKDCEGLPHQYLFQRGGPRIHCGHSRSWGLFGVWENPCRSTETRPACEASLVTGGQG